MGKSVSYADFIVLGALDFFKRMGEGVYEKVVEIEPTLWTMYEASKQWLERSQH